MFSLLVIKVDILVDPFVQFQIVLITIQVDVFILETAPKPFYCYIVRSPSLAIHAEPDTFAQYLFNKGIGSKLAHLLSNAALRQPLLRNGRIQRVDTEVGSQRIAEFPGKQIPAMPVDNRAQIHKALLHRNISNVHAPYLIGSVDFQTTQ